MGSAVKLSGGGGAGCDGGTSTVAPVSGWPVAPLTGTCDGGGFFPQVIATTTTVKASTIYLAFIFSPDSILIDEFMPFLYKQGIAQFPNRK